MPELPDVEVLRRRLPSEIGGRALMPRTCQHPCILEGSPAREVATRRGRIKAVGMDHRVLAGIGSARSHEIPFPARLHRLIPLNNLTGMTHPFTNRGSWKIRS